MKEPLTLEQVAGGYYLASGYVKVPDGRVLHTTDLLKMWSTRLQFDPPRGAGPNSHRLLLHGIDGRVIAATNDEEANKISRRLLFPEDM